MPPQLLGLALVLAGPAGYPQPGLLTEPADLMKHPRMLVLDVRGKNSYAAGHIPNGVWVDAITWERAFARPDADDWAKRLGQLGIDPRQPVVVYGDTDVRTPARVWWILRYWGVPDVRLLNGGWPAWQAAGGPVSTEEVKPQPATVTLTVQPQRLATKQQLQEALKGKPPQIVDARSHEEYCGQAQAAQRNGAIPGAIHLEWKECLDPKTHRFKTAAELAELLKVRHIDVNQAAVTYCQSGGRAAVVAFTLELMGGRQVKNYYKSWAEWGNADDTPIQQVPPKRQAGR